MASDPLEFDAYLKVLFHEILADGAIIISPRPGEFRRMERSFVEGLRRCPSVVDSPDGVSDPYQFATSKPGRWLFLWIPDRKH